MSAISCRSSVALKHAACSEGRPPTAMQTKADFPASGDTIWREWRVPHPSLGQISQHPVGITLDYGSCSLRSPLPEPPAQSRVPDQSTVKVAPYNGEISSYLYAPPDLKRELRIVRPRAEAAPDYCSAQEIVYANRTAVSSPGRAACRHVRGIGSNA